MSLSFQIRQFVWMTSLNCTQTFYVRVQYWYLSISLKSLPSLSYRMFSTTLDLKTSQQKINGWIPWKGTEYQLISILWMEVFCTVLCSFHSLSKKKELCNTRKNPSSIENLERNRSLKTLFIRCITYSYGNDLLHSRNSRTNFWILFILSRSKL